MASDKAPGWFHEKLAEVSIGHLAPLTERELASMLSPVDGPNGVNARAVAEILRLRKQLKIIFHSAPAPRGRKRA